MAKDTFDVRAHIDARLDSEHAAVALGMDNLTRLLEERHRYFDARIDGITREVELRHDSHLGLNVEHRTYVDAELAAVRVLFSAALVSQERAVQKAEEAQLRHNEQTNGYEAQLLEQYRHMMPRSEADVSHRALLADMTRLSTELTATQTTLSNVQVQLATKDQGEVRQRTRFDGTMAVLIGCGLIITPLLVFFLTHVH